MPRPFRNRTEAGRLLARELQDYTRRPDVIVLGLPRGGVPVAYEVARLLHRPLDGFLVRKLGVPGHEELAMGALAQGGIRVLNHDVIGVLAIDPETIERVTEAERRELERREAVYRGARPPLDVAGRTVILVDDGLATGSTMRAAVAALRKLGPDRIVVAVPTAAPATRDEFRILADACICRITPEPFHAVGLWYEDFAQTSDDEVCALLERAAKRSAATASG